MIGALSEDDIVALAAHFAKLPFKPAGEDFDAALAAEGKAIHDKDCAMCHGLPGAKAMAISLNGQKIAYLRDSLLKYASGEREEIKIMQDKLTALTPEQTEAILNFYASYRDD
jgi:sulfide dehydrogenase cytochrome subunit